MIIGIFALYEVGEEGGKVGKSTTIHSLLLVFVAWRECDHLYYSLDTSI